MTKEFKKYNDIENSYREAFIEKIVFSGLSKETFHVEEKIHGANFQFYVSNDETVCGKRTDFISDGEKFFSWKLVFEKYKNAVEQLRERYFKDYDIIVYGELFGGSYPHPDVPRDTKFSNVQKEIFYAPIQDFICFDIYIHSENEEAYIDTTKRNKLCEEFGIPYAKTLFTGTLEECLKYPNHFLTTIPKEYGLPDIEDNICEGVVIRPERDLRVRTGERAIVKNKNERFTEKKARVKTDKPIEELPEHIVTMIDNINQYINENRLNNMLSKIGEATPKDFGLYIQMYSKDVYQDFFKDYNEEFKNWEKSDQKKFQKEVNQIVVNFLKTNLLTKI
jgi:Rnl2 family RNA ligase